MALDAGARAPRFYLLARNASEVWHRTSPLRAALRTPPSTATMFGSAARERGGRLVGLSGGRLLLLTPRAASGFAYELVRCEAPKCAPADCALLGSAAPTSGEVVCSPLGAGDVGADGPQLADAARADDAALASLHSVADVDADGAVALTPTPSLTTAPPARGNARRQWLLLDDGSASSGLYGRALLEYEAPSAQVRFLRLALPTLGFGRSAAANGGVDGAHQAAGSLSQLAPSAASAELCDALPQADPSPTASWAFPMHRLSALGGASVLDVDVPTAEFRVWRCQDALPAAGKHDARSGAAAFLHAKAAALPMAPCVAIDHGVWPPLSSHPQAVWLGDSLGDALLLFDETSGEYEAWPLRRLADRVMPRPGQRPLASGTWPALIGHQLVYADSSTLVALHPATGRYQIVLLDSSALLFPVKHSSHTPPPSLPYGTLASGSLGVQTSAAAATAVPEPRPCAFSYHAATYLGDDLLISVEPSSSDYCVLRLSRQDPTVAPLSRVGGGNLRHAPCAQHSACGTCTAQDGCGWCAATGMCLQGDALADCAGSCREHWTFGYCANQPCAHHSTCDDCLATEVCGWCAASQTCMAGSDAQPLELTCQGGYRFHSCSERTVVNATVTD